MLYNLSLPFFAVLPAEAAMRFSHQTAEADVTEPSEDEHYKSMNCPLTAVDKTSEEWKLIEQYVRTMPGPAPAPHLSLTCAARSSAAHSLFFRKRFGTATAGRLPATPATRSSRTRPASSSTRSSLCDTAFP